MRNYLLYLCLFLLLLYTFLVYFTSLHFDFIRGLDDGWMVIDNPAIRDFSWKGIKFLFTEDKLDTYYYPLSYLSLALDYRCFGLDPFYMKLHNLLLHLISGILVFHISLRIIPVKSVALFTTALFLLHPLQVENVAWVACRRQVLVQFNFLFSLLLYIKFIQNNKSVRWLFFSGSFVFFNAALFSKFSAAPLPLLLLLCALLFDTRENKFLAFRKHLFLLIPFFAVAFLMYHMNQDALAHNYMITEYHYTAIEHLLIFFNSFSFYIFKALFPLGLSVAYLSPIEGKVFSAVFITSALGGIVLILIAAWTSRVSKVVSFGMLYFVLLITPSANTFLFVSYLPFTLSDRYFYLASTGLFLSISYILHRALLSQKVFSILTLLIITLLSYLTLIQLQVWKSTSSLLEHNSRHQPNKELLYRLAVEYLQSGDTINAGATITQAKSLSDNIFINNPFPTWLQFADVAIKTGDTLLATELFATALDRDLKCEVKIATQLLKEFDLANHIDQHSYMAVRDTLMRRECCTLKPRRF